VYDDPEDIFLHFESTLFYQVDEVITINSAVLLEYLTVVDYHVSCGTGLSTQLKTGPGRCW